MSTTEALLPFFGAGYQVVGVERAPNETNSDTAQTCARMAKIVGLAARNPDVQSAAAQACMGCGGSREAIANAVFNWIRGRVRFEQDESIVAAGLLSAGMRVDPDAELLVAPWVLLSMPRPCGDCDDFSMLSASMLAARGVPSEIVCIAADPRQPQRWSHVFLHVVLENGTRLPMDTSHTPDGLPVGWEAPRQYRKQVFATILPIRTTGLNGLGAAAATPAPSTWEAQLAQSPYFNPWVALFAGGALGLLFGDGYGAAVLGAGAGFGAWFLFEIQQGGGL